MISVQRFSDEQSWLAARGDSIGASEVASLLGVGWGTREKLIAEKAGRTHRKFDIKARRRMNAGKLLEPVIGALISTEMGRLPIPCGFTIYRNPLFPHLHATPDFWLIEGEELVEAKSTGPDGLSDWGTFSGYQGRFVWNAEPPVKVSIQVQAQFAATGAAMGHVWCLAGTSWNRWPVQRDDELIATIGAAVESAIQEITAARESQKEAQ